MAIHRGSEAGGALRAASGLSWTAKLPSRGVDAEADGRGRDPSEVLQRTASTERGHLTSSQPVTIVEAAAPRCLHLERRRGGHVRRWVTLCDFGLLHPGGGLFPGVGGSLSLSLPQLPCLYNGISTVMTYFHSHSE